jgi:hypothetical protein
MYDLIGKRKIADIAYAPVFMASPNGLCTITHYVANHLISTIFNVLYN